MLSLGRGRRRQLGEVIGSPDMWGSEWGCLSEAIVSWGQQQDCKGSLALVHQPQLALQAGGSGMKASGIFGREAGLAILALKDPNPFI